MGGDVMRPGHFARSARGSNAASVRTSGLYVQHRLSYLPSPTAPAAVTGRTARWYGTDHRPHQSCYCGRIQLTLKQPTESLVQADNSIRSSRGLFLNYYTSFATLALCLQVTMTSTNSFVSSSSGEEWSRVLDLYEQVLRLKASKMQKQASGKSLLILDAWFQKELPKAIQQRGDKYITHEELAKLMEWKLTRGKFRPRLKEMVKTNSPELVEGASKKAFKKLPNVSSAIKELTVLKAVGPATASAILAAGAPECAPFMADESMLAVPGCTPLAYTDSAYKRYCEAVQKCVTRLNKEDSSTKWTPHKVELALWTHYMVNKLDPSILDQPNGTAPKRKSTDEKGETAKKHRDK